MTESNLRKSAAIAGVLFVVLLVVSFVLILPAPMADKSAAKIVSWYAKHREAVYVSGALGALSSVAFLWFLGYLHHAVSALSGTTRFLSSVLLASGVYTLTVVAATSLPSAALAVAASRPGVTPADSVVHLLVDLNNLSGGVISVGLAVFLFVIGLLLADGALRPKWATWIAHVGALANLLGGVSAYFVSKAGKPNPVSILGLLGVLLFAIVILAISLELWSAPASSATPAAVAATT
jgi:hypothetical protein